MGTEGGCRSGSSPSQEDAPPAWQAPTAVEQALYAAGLREDWPAFHRVLGGTDLFFPMSRELADVLPDRIRFAPFRDPHVDGLCLAVFTRGMLPPPAAGQVFERAGLAALARNWPRSVRWLAVNPGTPVEAFLPAEPRRWKRHARRAAAEPRLKTLWTGHRTGPLAHGMACGALLLVNNGSLWNHLGWQSSGYTEERTLLRTSWDVTGRRGWQAVQQRLLEGRMVPSVWEFALRVRQALLQEYGALPGAAAWRETAERVLVSRTAEVVDRTGLPPEFDLDADIALVQETIGRILRYEARFRADGVLEGGACVRSVLAWDFGRASCMARWGLGARYCEVAETEAAVLGAGAAGRRTYRSWADFSAGYILGRCLHFDGEEFGEWYTDVLAVHRLLTREPGSPWLTLPWEQPSSDLTDR